MHEETKLKGSHYVATHGRLTPDPPYVHSNRGYSTDGEESHSHRAPSERTYSEYTLTHERISPQSQYNSSRKKRSANGHHQHLQHSYSHSQMGLSSSPDNGGPRSLSGPPPTRQPPRAPSALSYDHGGDGGSDIYVTSAAYKAPSEISRYSQRPVSRGPPRSVYSVASTAKTGRSARSTTKRGAKIETMSAPNPLTARMLRASAV
ncbi:GL10269 [Drosophila persimilis]|uniref:GL10269 n=1 Tax=Drosophila persimilis TaxID=7234 RepID=B4ISD4_DROPE|nr:GL10269 [Drosophila persimilis]